LNELTINEFNRIYKPLETA